MAIKKGIGTTGIVIISSVAVLGLGLGLFFILRKRKKDKEEESTDESTDGSTDESNKSNTSTKSSTKKKSCPLPKNIKIKKPKDVNTTEFQTWVDKNRGKSYKDTDCKYYNFCKGDRVKKGICGSWGQQTQQAWDKHGKAYLYDAGYGKDGKKCPDFLKWLRERYYGISLVDYTITQGIPVVDDYVDEGYRDKYKVAMKEIGCKPIISESSSFLGKSNDSNMVSEIDELKGTDIN